MSPMWIVAVREPLWARRPVVPHAQRRKLAPHIRIAQVSCVLQACVTDLLGKLPTLGDAC